MKRYLQIVPFFVLLAVVLACASTELAPNEKDMFVRGADLADYGIQVREPEKYEKFNKTVYFDGSFDIEYEFDPPETEEIVYLSETITYEHSKSDAKIGRVAEDSLIGLALRSQGLEKVEVPNFYKYGDSSLFYALKKDGKNVGNYFTVLQGGKVFSLIISGVYFDDVETWRELVEPKLKRFSEYQKK